MSILIAEELAKSYGAQDVFWDVSFQVARGDKIALIGPNGQGKTSLLEILAGRDQASAGTVTWAKNLAVGYLPQIAEIESERTLWDEMLTAFGPLLAMQARLRELEQEMTDPALHEEALAEYGELQERFERAGGYTYAHEIERVLMGVGFKTEEFSLPMAVLSGGQKTRALLAKLLLQDMDVLLLDEPTNHLDLFSVEWLESYLKEWPGTLIVVAHDRYFLDEVANRVWELSLGRLETYRGNYSAYVQQRAERYDGRMAAYEAQQQEIARAESFIRRYKAGQRTREARSREHRLERMGRLEKPQESRTMKLSMQTDIRTGDLVLTSDGMEIGYPPNGTLPGVTLLRCPPFVVRRGEKVALLGPNGTGKTTLLRTIIGEIPPLSGDFRLGAGVRIGYVPQGYSDLHLERDVLDEILSVKNIPIGKARDLLGRFLFSGDDVYKKIGELSGGERARVELAKLTLLRANFLLMDEPTSHLDMVSREVLEEVLLDFNGTLLFVSHDRYFISAIATQVWVIDGSQLKVYPLDYSEYLEAREKERRRVQEAEKAPRPQPKRATPTDTRSLKEMAKRAQDAEADVARLEARLAELEAEIAGATERQDARAVWELGQEYTEVQDALHWRLEEWTKLVAQLQVQQGQT